MQFTRKPCLNVRGTARTEHRARRALPTDDGMSVLCVSLLLSISLGAVIGYGLARALLGIEPVTLEGPPS